MLVIHISCTPLAGAPIRIVNALNKFTEYKSRLVNLNPNCYGTRTFPEDLIWSNDNEECLELISKADILHFYHFFDFESINNPFGINFLNHMKPQCKFVRMFESDLTFVAKGSSNMISKIISDKYPKLVIPHYPERTFLDAFVVPNIIPINDPILQPIETNNEITKVFFSASSDTSIWHTRWNTKGMPEVKNKFSKLSEKTSFKFSIIQNTPYIECQKLKQQNDIVIGDTTSGSYHLTDLESLSQGKPTFTYLDNRSQMVLQNLLECPDLPFINSRLEEIDLPFLAIVNDKSLQKEIGNFSREWIEKYYSEQRLVKFYEEAYEKILNGEPVYRQNYFKHQTAKRFLYNSLYDLQWETRKNVSEKKDCEGIKLHSDLPMLSKQSYKLSEVFPFLRIIQEGNIKKFMLWRFIPIRKVVFDGDKVHKYLFGIKYRTVSR